MIRLCTRCRAHSSVLICPLCRGVLVMALQAGDHELCITNGDQSSSDGLDRTVGFSFRTDVLIDEDLSSEGQS